MILFKQMLILLIIMIVGVVLEKQKILNEDNSKVLSALVVNVANPALIISSGISSEMTISEFAKVLLLANAIFLSMMVLAYLLCRILRVKKEQEGIYRCMFIFSNIGFMGLPLVKALYGAEAVLYASVFLLPFNFLIYTYGIGKMSKGKAKFSVRKIFNMGTIAGAIAIFITLTKLRVPEVLSTTIQYLSNMTVPLSMIIIGAACSKMKLQELVTDVTMDLFLVLKMIVIPIAAVVLLKYCGIEGSLLGVCMVMVASPVGSMNAMLAQQYNCDVKTVSKGLVLSTVMSILTMPLVSLFI